MTTMRLILEWEKTSENPNPVNGSHRATEGSEGGIIEPLEDVENDGILEVSDEELISQMKVWEESL